MRYPGRSRLLIVILAVIELAACSGNPYKRKMAFLAKGEAYRKQGNNAAAVIELRNAVQIDPKFADGHYQLANAEASPREAIRLDPQYSRAYTLLAQVDYAERSPLTQLPRLAE